MLQAVQPIILSSPLGAGGGARGRGTEFPRLSSNKRCVPSADSVSLVGGPFHPTELGKASRVPCYPAQGGTGRQPHRKPTPGWGWGVGYVSWWEGRYKECPRALPSEGHLPTPTGLSEAPLPPPGNPLPQAWHCWPTTWLPSGGAEGELGGAPWLLWSRGATWWPLSECASSLRWRVAFHPEGQQPCR